MGSTEFSGHGWLICPSTPRNFSFVLGSVFIPQVMLSCRVIPPTPHLFFTAASATVNDAMIKTLKKRGTPAGPPIFDDLVVRNPVADEPNRLWLSDITEHRTAWISGTVATVRT